MNQNGFIMILHKLTRCSIHRRQCVRIDSDLIGNDSLHESDVSSVDEKRPSPGSDPLVGAARWRREARVPHYVVGVVGVEDF